MYSSSLVTIEESNDPYGILSVEPSAVSVEEEFKKVNLTIQRTGTQRSFFIKPGFFAERFVLLVYILISKVTFH